MFCVKWCKQHIRYQGGGWQSIPPPWAKLGVYPVDPPEIFTKSLLRRLLTWNKSFVTTDRLVTLERMVMHPKKLASKFWRTVFYYRKLEEFGGYFFIFFIMNKNSLLLVAFLWYTFIFNFKYKHRNYLQSHARKISMN